MFLTEHRMYKTRLKINFTCQINVPRTKTVVSTLVDKKKENVQSCLCLTTVILKQIENRTRPLSSGPTLHKQVTAYFLSDSVEDENSYILRLTVPVPADE